MRPGQPGQWCGPIEDQSEGASCGELLLPGPPLPTRLRTAEVASPAAVPGGVYRVPIWFPQPRAVLDVAVQAGGRTRDRCGGAAARGGWAQAGTQVLVLGGPCRDTPGDGAMPWGLLRGLLVPGSATVRFVSCWICRRERRFSVCRRPGALRVRATAWRAARWAAARSSAGSSCGQLACRRRLPWLAGRPSSPGDMHGPAGWLARCLPLTWQRCVGPRFSSGCGRWPRPWPVTGPEWKCLLRREGRLRLQSGWEGSCLRWVGEQVLAEQRRRLCPVACRRGKMDNLRRGGCCSMPGGSCVAERPRGKPD